RQDHLLAQQAHKVAVGLQQGRAATAQEAGLDLARIADEQWGQQQHEEHLGALLEKLEDQDHTSIESMSTKSKAISAAKTRLRYWRIVRNCRRVSFSAAKATALPSGA